MSESLRPEELNWIGVRFLDRLGRVFRLDGEYYRAIYPHRVAYARHLLSLPTIHRLMDAGLLVESRVSSLEVEGYGMVIHHDKAAYRLPSSTWGRLQLRDAAESYLQLNLALLREGLALIDGHSANFAQLGKAKPTWIDFGSIIELNGQNEFPSEVGLKEFRTAFLNPLRFLAKSNDFIRLTRVILEKGG